MNCAAIFRSRQHASMLRSAALIVALALSAHAAHARSIEGRVVRVVDGDTLWLQPDGPDRKPVKLRLVDIDAPERCQEGGTASTRTLASRVLHQRVTAEIRAQDDYKRGLARVLLNGDDVNAWMVAQGMAWSLGWRGRPGAYATEEREAVSERRGVRGRAGAMSPRDFRAQHGPCEAAPPRHERSDTN